VPLSPNSWINDGDNDTQGNNVDAHLDLNADDVPDLPRPTGSPFRVFDFFQDMYLVAETLVGNTPVVPTPADYYTNPAKGWLVTRTKLGTPYPTVLTPTGTLFKQIIENLSGGDRPVYDQGFVGPNGGDFAFNFGSAVAGPGRDDLEAAHGRRFPFRR
jgi:hypothetical protein